MRKQTSYTVNLNTLIVCAVHYFSLDIYSAFLLLLAWTPQISQDITGDAGVLCDKAAMLWGAIEEALCVYNTQFIWIYCVLVQNDENRELWICSFINVVWNRGQMRGGCCEFHGCVFLLCTVLTICCRRENLFINWRRENWLCEF